MTNERLSQPDPRGYGSPADPLSAHLDAYERHLTERGYAARYIKACKGGIEHLSLWMATVRKRDSQFDEALVREFLDVHLSRCCCASAGRDRRTLRAALGHLLVVLRAAGITAQPSPNAGATDFESDPMSTTRSGAMPCRAATGRR